MSDNAASGVVVGECVTAFASCNTERVPIILRRRTRRTRRDVLARRDHSGADLHGAKLYDLDLHGKVFRGANLTRADLTACNLTGADLEGADLTAAFLTGAQLDGANLRDANLTAVYALATEFGNADMRGAILDRATYDQATEWPMVFYRPGRTAFSVALNYQRRLNT